MDKDGNVIEFPRQKRLFKPVRGKKVRFDLEEKRVLVSASLVSILVLFTLVNFSIGTSFVETQDPNGPARDLAYVASGKKVDKEWETGLIKRLSSFGRSQRTTAGARPTALEKFSYGVLGGKYVVRFENGKVHELEFSQPEGSNGNPKYIGDRVTFLLQNRPFWPVSFKKMVRVKEGFKLGKVLEIYNLLDAEKGVVGQVEFRLDAFGRLIFMKMKGPAKKAGGAGQKTAQR